MKSRNAGSAAMGVVTYDAVREAAFAFPDVEDGTSYGTPALKVRKKLMARLREDGDSVAFRVRFDDREILMKARPGTFYITDHYKPYQAVLVRLSRATRQELADVVELAWRYVAPKKVVASYDAGRQ